ncbi:MAG: methyltransferase [Xanthomonadales bacterium]|jgi:predicted methyltransferase|nr:methyltransferase [Xanthomonadales bacterium]
MKSGLNALILGLGFGAVLLSPPAQADASYIERVALSSVADHRSAGNRARNEYRHPAQTLGFFGFEAGDSVLEIWPGGGWYTEILAPAIRGQGTFTVANWDPEVEGQPDYRYELPRRLQARFDANPDIYDEVRVVHFSPPESASLGEENSYDLVLTFRNTHGWVGDGIAESIYAEFARVLKPGGVLGVVQHRAAPGTDPLETAASGYVSEEAVKAIAAAVGLEFAGASEVNANPADDRQHPEGVWTLPPGLNVGDEDRDRYLAIGESDRMTLKFVKPGD